MTGRLHTREDSGLVLDREGQWLHDGHPVAHPKIVEAFNRGLERTPEGRYIVRFGNDWAFVTVEDVPLQVHSAVADPSRNQLLLSFSNGVAEPLRPETLTQWNGVLYCVASSGMPARFSRSAQFTVGSMMDEDERGHFLALGAERHPVVERSPERAVPPPATGA